MGAVSAAALVSRQQLPSAQRVVVKIGSSSLTDDSGHLDAERLRALVDVLAARRAAGQQVVLVSSGAIAAGMGPLGLATRPRDLATQQAAASVGQGRLIAHYTQAFHRHSLHVAQVLLTADDTVRRGHYRNAHRALARLLDLGVVPVVNIEGIGPGQQAGRETAVGPGAQAPALLEPDDMPVFPQRRVQVFGARSQPAAVRQAIDQRAQAPARLRQPVDELVRGISADGPDRVHVI